MIPDRIQVGSRAEMLRACLTSRIDDHSLGPEIVVGNELWTGILRRGVTEPQPGPEIGCLPAGQLPLESLENSLTNRFRFGLQVAKPHELRQAFLELVSQMDVELRHDVVRPYQWTQKNTGHYFSVNDSLYPLKLV